VAARIAPRGSIANFFTIGIVTGGGNGGTGPREYSASVSGTTGVIGDVEVVGPVEDGSGLDGCDVELVVIVSHASRGRTDVVGSSDGA